MGKKRKFEEIGRNEAYYASHENDEEKNVKASEESFLTRLGKRAGEKLLKVDAEKEPADKKAPSRFTYTKEKRRVMPDSSMINEVEDISKAPLAFMLTVVCLVLVANVISSSKAFLSLPAGNAYVAKILLMIGAYAVPSVIYMVLMPSFGNKLCNLKPFSASMLSVTAVALGLVISSGLLQKYFITYTFSYNIPVGAIRNNVWISILSGALVPAICEELFVRGVFQYEISRYAGGITGILAGALVFGFVHYDLQYFSVYFTAGLVLGALTHITHSVIPSMIVHFLNNTISILFSDKLAYIALRHIGGTLFMIVLGSLCFLFLILLLRHVENISRKRALEFLPKKQDGEPEDGTGTDKKRKNAKVMKEAYYFISPKGRTAARMGKVFSSVLFITAAVVFAAVVIIKLNLK